MVELEAAAGLLPHAPRVWGQGCGTGDRGSWSLLSFVRVGAGGDSAWRNRAPGPDAHRNTARQATDGLWTEARGQQKQSNDPGNNQHILNTPIYLLGAADAQTAHHATFSTAPTHQLLGSANAETTPARAPAAAADRKQRPDATCEGKNG